MHRTHLFNDGIGNDAVSSLWASDMKLERQEPRRPREQIQWLLTITKYNQEQNEKQRANYLDPG